MAFTSTTVTLAAAGRRLLVPCFSHAGACLAYPTQAARGPWEVPQQ